jgi:hypothetical protein
MRVLCSEKEAEKREKGRERKRQREIGKLNEKACPGETAINCILLNLGLQTQVIL